MNNVKSIQALNKRELENVVPPSASWHTDYRDTAYVYIGGLSFDLSEGDIETIFSQYGVPTWIKLQRDKETGKSRGFAFLKYEDQRSCDLAVDNLGGATVLGRILRVDHSRYKTKEGEEEEDQKHAIRFEAPVRKAEHQENKDSKEARISRPKTKAERELDDLLRNHDEDDPMKEFLINEKREEVAVELAALEKRKDSSRRHRHRHDRHREDEGKDRDRRRRRDHSSGDNRSFSPDRHRRDRSPERRHRDRSRENPRRQSKR